MTHKIIFTIKEPTDIESMTDALNLDKATYREYFEFGEYVTIELEVDEALRIVSGRMVPLAEL